MKLQGSVDNLLSAREWGDCMSEFWFCFGKDDDRRSSVWKLWTHKSEFYLASRMMGSSTKVSIHSPCQGHSTGQGQWSMSSEWYGQYHPGQPNSGRHIVRWVWDVPADTTASHVFRLDIPGSELRVIRTTENLRKVRWLEPPAIGQVGRIEIYVSPAPLDQALLARRDVLCALGLDGEKSVVAFVSYADVCDADWAQLKNVRAEAAAKAAAVGVPANPNFRAAALFGGESGPRGMVEFVPFVVAD